MNLISILFVRRNNICNQYRSIKILFIRMLQTLIILLTTASYFYYHDSNWLGLKMNRVPLINSIITGVSSSIIIWNNPDFYLEYKEKTDFYYAIPGIVLFAYSFYDLFYSIKEKNIDFFIHGLIAFFSGYIAFYINPSLSPALTYCCLTETSTIFLNLRVFRKRWLDYLFVVTFIFYRIFYIPYVTYLIYVSDAYENRDKYVIVIISHLFFGLNIYWLTLIIKKIICRHNV
jgi:hypothetical protein